MYIMKSKSNYTWLPRPVYIIRQIIYVNVLHNVNGSLFLFLHKFEINNFFLHGIENRNPFTLNSHNNFDIENQMFSMHTRYIIRVHDIERNLCICKFMLSLRQ